MTQQDKRARLLTKLTGAVAQLLDAVEADTKHARDAGVGLDGVRRARVEEGLTHRVTEPGLLRQLVAALKPSGAAVGAAGGGSKPEGRAPSQAAVSALLASIGREAATHRYELRKALPEAKLPVRMRRTVYDDIADMRSLAVQAPDHLLKEVADDAAGWVSTARVLLTWDSPIMTLRDSVCPYCGGELKVRSDADSDVWCAGIPAGQDTVRQPPCRDEEGERRSWPRSTWVMLLERLADSRPVAPSA